MAEGQEIRRDMTVRKYSFRGRGRIGRVKSSTNVNRNGGAGGGGTGSSAGSKTLVRFGVLERLTLGLGGFRVFLVFFSFFSFFSPPPVVSGEGTGVSSETLGESGSMG